MKKVILITGASSGIGKATAMQLIKDGYIVYGAARRVDNMKDLVNAGGHSIAMDVTRDDNVDDCVNQIIREQGKIDVLVNNAGYAVYGPVEAVSLTDARRQFDVNIFGLALLTQKVLPHMRKQNSGTIVNISSIGGKIFTPFGAWYHATKHALEGWSDCLRLELKEFGINVVIIEPGIIQTEFGDVMYEPMIKTVANTVYEKTGGLVAKASRGTYNNPKSVSPPSVIAEVISKAVKSKNPKTRYASGKMAQLLLRMRRWTSDKTFEKLVMQQVERIK